VARPRRRLGRLQGRMIVRQRHGRVRHRTLKTELIHRRGPWRGLDDVEFATLEYVDWSTTNDSTANSGSSHPSSSRGRLRPSNQPRHRGHHPLTRASTNPGRLSESPGADSVPECFQARHERVVQLLRHPQGQVALVPDLGHRGWRGPLLLGRLLPAAELTGADRGSARPAPHLTVGEGAPQEVARTAAAPAGPSRPTGAVPGGLASTHAFEDSAGGRRRRAEGREEVADRQPVRHLPGGTEPLIPGLVLVQVGSLPQQPRLEVHERHDHALGERREEWGHRERQHWIGRMRYPSAPIPSVDASSCALSRCLSPG
jgi:hypothetical protein